MDEILAVANAELKSQGCPLKICVRSDKLVIRGTMSFDCTPPKSRREATGLPSIPLSVSYAKAKAYELWDACTNNPLSQYRNDVQISDISRFCLEFRGFINAQSKSVSTWQKSYKPYLDKIARALHQNPSLEAACLAVLLSYRSNRRARQVCRTVINQIYEWKGMEVPSSIASEPATYSLEDSESRDLPADEEILYWHSRIPNSSWQNLYAKMAVYGLRNHEAFKSHLFYGSDGKLMCQVHEDTKTGDRVVFPYPESWVDDFGLTPESSMPSINGDSQRIGQQVSLQFKRYKIPFRPLILRHAFACRAIIIGNDYLVAKALGHSVDILHRIYRRHLSKEALLRHFTQALAS